MQELLFMHRQMCDSHLAEASKFGAIGAISDQLVTLHITSKYLIIFDTIIYNKHNEYSWDTRTPVRVSHARSFSTSILGISRVSRVAQDIAIGKPLQENIRRSCSRLCLLGKPSTLVYSDATPRQLLLLFSVCL